MSDQAGRSNVMAELERIGLDVKKDDPRIGRLLEDIKQREAQGYAYEAADARSSYWRGARLARCQNILMSSTST